MTLTNESTSKRLPGSVVLRIRRPDTVDSSTLNANEARVCGLLNGRRTVNEVLSSSGLPGFATTRILRALVDRGIVEVVPAAAERVGSATMDLTHLLRQRRASRISETRAVSRQLPSIQVAGSPLSEPRPRSFTPNPVQAEAASSSDKAVTTPSVAEAADQSPSTATELAARRPEADTLLEASEPAASSQAAAAPEVGPPPADPVPDDSDSAGHTLPSPSPAPGTRSVAGEIEVASPGRSQGASPNLPSASLQSKAALPAEASPLTPASGLAKRVHVGPYRVVGRLAKGGVGSIYLCSRVGAFGFRRLFALKVIRQHLDTTVDAEHAFATEARIAGTLSHPHLNAVVDAGLYEQQPYLIMPYVEGMNLHELLSTGRSAPPSVIISVICDVLAGLQYLHDLVDDDGSPLCLVHGDISPDNILVGVDGSARLTDFGRVRSATAIQSADVRGMVGKSGFMAPEQMQGQRIDGRTDLFSLGIVLWTALTGKTLFADETFEATVMNTLRRQVARPSLSGAPVCLDDICLRALSRNPETRFRTADEMRIALQTAAAANGLLASSAQVSAWVRDSGSEQFAERRRLILLDAATSELESSAPRPPAHPRDTVPLATAGGSMRTLILPRQFTPRMGQSQSDELRPPEKESRRADVGPRRKGSFVVSGFVVGLLCALLASGVVVAIIFGLVSKAEPPPASAPSDAPKAVPATTSSPVSRRAAQPSASDAGSRPR